ncbi:MAG: cobalt-precorrin-6A reductase [Methylocystaceae bacterium]|nr:MAG: cobalt-precorrin-6A reductase [Methylocystaceae bacterium]
MSQTKPNLETKRHAAPHSSGGAATRALILGGTGEARRFAARIAGDPRIDAIISLAGRTSEPLEQSLPARVGGFGGVQGLIHYLEDERIDKVVDATHPFAARMSSNARQACAALNIPLIALSRAPWSPLDDDRWIDAADNAAAVAALGAAPRRVFLTTGRLGLADFLLTPQHFYLIRTIDRPPPADLPPHHELILDRGPFTVESELSLMRDAHIDVIVSKNSGGGATYAKIAAARELRIEVVMIAPPRREDVETVHDIEQALAFLLERRAA